MPLFVFSGGGELIFQGQRNRNERRSFLAVGTAKFVHLPASTPRQFLFLFLFSHELKVILVDRIYIVVSQDRLSLQQVSQLFLFSHLH